MKYLDSYGAFNISESQTDIDKIKYDLEDCSDLFTANLIQISRGGPEKNSTFDNGKVYIEFEVVINDDVMITIFDPKKQFDDIVKPVLERLCRRYNYTVGTFISTNSYSSSLYKSWSVASILSPDSSINEAFESNDIELIEAALSNFTEEYNLDLIEVQNKNTMYAATDYTNEPITVDDKFITMLNRTQRKLEECNCSVHFRVKAHYDLKSNNRNKSGKINKVWHTTLGIVSGDINELTGTLIQVINKLEKDTETFSIKINNIFIQIYPR